MPTKSACLFFFFPYLRTQSAVVAPDDDVVIYISGVSVEIPSADPQADFVGKVA
ncbi:MAG TPA: hypothetical protein VFS47_09460 [Steroidobacteraceae bacterium]|nr:hypothetical protein [Steroidobacteraceae bacterium]